ncbi:MAG: ATP-binding domain-containing protein [Deltaproteobacteria bacterium]|nr:ATP-binding domain-containing protein [Deltaproteobacteria bacterium]
MVNMLKLRGEAESGISIISLQNDSSKEIYDTLCNYGVPCDLVTAKPTEVAGVRLFLALLTVWVKPDRLDFATWWYLMRNFNHSSDITLNEIALIFEDAWKSIQTRTPEQNTHSLAAIFGFKGDDGYRVAVYNWLTTERLDQVNKDTLLRLVETLAKHDQTIQKDRIACERVAKLLGTHESFKKDPLRVIGEMTRRDFAGSAHINQNGVQISTIHQYKGLENDSIIVDYDFNPDQSVERQRLEYVALSRAKKNVVLCR